MTPEELLDSDLRLPSGTTSGLINKFLAGTPMEGLGYSFMEAELHYRVNARYFVAHAVLESNWGRSEIAQKKKNLFGFMAYDRDPYGNAKTFTSFNECIDYVARYVAREYLTPGGKWFVTPTLRGMSENYATDPEWPIKVARIMAQVPQVTVMLNGKKLDIDYLMLLQGRVYVPVRVLEQLGVGVHWNEQTSGVELTLVDINKIIEERDTYKSIISAIKNLVSKEV